MRPERLLEYIPPVCVIGGGIALAAGGSGIPSALGSTSAVGVAGLSLMLVGATAGLLANVMLRRQSRNLAKQASESFSPGNLQPLEPPANILGPLVRSINECLAESERIVQGAQEQVRELEIQLKVATSQRRQAQAIIESINDAVLVTNAFDEVILANASAGKTLGFDPATIDRQPVDQVITDAALATAIRDVRLSGNPNERRESEHRFRLSPRDPERVFKLTLSAIAQSGKEPAGVVAVFHDMTRENEIARLKNEFVSSVSHELRTPLASIRAYVEMLIDGEAQDAKTAREFYDIIHAEADRLGRLIDNILSISRIESGLVEVKKAPVCPTVIVKQALEVIGPQAKLKNISIEEQLEPAFYQVNADREMLYQAVLNLLSNAVKYTREGGTVTARVSVDEAAKRCTVRVIDTGVGIPAKDLPFVFEKFFRVEENKSVAKGTGLGLSLVKNIIETAHKGRMFVESEQGRGSCFGFELPLC